MNRPSTPSLERLLKISLFNGMSIAVVAGLATLLTLVIGDWLGVVVGLLVTGAGLIEIRGHSLLKRGQPSGCHWLKNAQLFLLSVLWIYCLYQLTSFDSTKLMDALPADSRQLLASSGIDIASLAPLIRTASFAVYGGVLLATLIHQGGLYLYYRRQTPAVLTALQPPPIPTDS